MFDIATATTNWPWDRIVSVASVLIALATAVASFLAAKATKRAAEAVLLAGFLKDYGEMSEALSTLGRWRDREGETFATSWREKFKEHDVEAKAVYRARRDVGSYFYNAEQLYRVGLISKPTLRAAIDRWGLSVFFEAGAPLELDERVDLSYIKRLRKLCPHRVQPSAWRTAGQGPGLENE